jgi:N-glycosylase/DNA lyase
MLSPGEWEGVAYGCHLRVQQDKTALTFYGVSEKEFETVWKNYFDLGRDYGSLKTLLEPDPVMAAAIAYAPGMRVLRQEPWEALCSFIFSQHNNIPRIKGLVERFCDAFGEAKGSIRAFPTPETVASLTIDDMAPVRAGFRAKYILDAARKVACGEVDLSALPALPISEARTELMKINGVGPKVADCALLFGLAHPEAFPIDVWITRVMDTYYPDGFPEAFAPVAGLAQMYLFHYARNHL